MKSTIKTGVVSSFRGDYAFLSNHYVAPFQWRGKTFFCAEQAFQYAKTFYPIRGEEQKCKDLGMRLLDTGNGATAKKYGQEIPLNVEMWDGVKVQIMREIVTAKFRTGKDLVGPLLNTGAMMLVEGNDWGDTFWGRAKVDGKMVGLNTLGVILMEVRGRWLYQEFLKSQDH